MKDEKDYAGLASPANAGRVTGVQNGVARFAGVESEKSEKSEKSMEPESIMFDGSLKSRSGCPKWGHTGQNGLRRGEVQETYMSYKSYKSHEGLCRTGVQNERTGCPKWGSPLRWS